MGSRGESDEPSLEEVADQIAEGGESGAVKKKQGSKRKLISLTDDTDDSDFEITPPTGPTQTTKPRRNTNYGTASRKPMFQSTLDGGIGSSSQACRSSDDIETINESIKNLEITPEMIRQFLPEVNWDQLASMYFKDRSAAECEARWMSSEDPLINHGPWTAEEENNLRLIIQEKGLQTGLTLLFH
ncbi:hypothetical protein Bca52824_066088 [Brassica carinata]|uniref:Myb-like domain-containing protein n=1 Tax=Brassica carinata TaxID=52824 RepID=A0A8X7QPS0_BRACI|nr:hypothetical protein Bca52824_066088 [Brassica carinata]